MQRFSPRFTVGFVAALATAFLLNVLSHFWMRFNDVKDGYDTIGFPFVFQREGGLGWRYEFHAVALLLDIMLALIGAYTVGRVCTRNQRRPM